MVSVIVLGVPILDAFKKKHASCRGALDAWQMEVERETWSGPTDIRARYKSADFLANNRVIFNIKGNNFRLVVKVRYQQGIVLIEWVGTHAEYDRERF